MRDPGRPMGKVEAPTGEARVVLLREARPGSGTLVAGATVLGTGLGGLIDVIVLHQLLQWHHMVSSLVPADNLPGLQLNTLADGWFAASMWLAIAVGLALLWRGVKRSATVAMPTRAFVGWMLTGWGLFHFVDSITFHALLGWHHIRPGPNFLAYDLGFFAIGLGLFLGGLALARPPKALVS